MVAYHISVFVHAEPVSMYSSVSFQVVFLDQADIALPDQTSVTGNDDF